MDFAQEVKGAADIVAVVSGHVRLKARGGNRYWGLCPFHQEKTPSFSVHGGLQIYKCFGCGKSGDVFAFLMEIQGLSFMEALKTLADQQGRAIPRKGGGPASDQATKTREALLHIHEVAQGFFSSQLRAATGSRAARYLQNRGVGLEAIKEFGLGYAPPGNALMSHLKGRGFTRSHVLASGLIAKSDKDRSIYDRFRDRLMFPIHSTADKVIGYGGRVQRADKQPKYLNSPETPIYSKQSVLFNLNRARMAMRKQDLAVLVEGYMDVVGVWSAGVRNAVATCGTALTAQQIGMVRRHCKTVVVNFDSDEAGQAAAERSVKLLLREGMNVRVLELPGGMDPDEYCLARGGDSYIEELHSAPRYFHWLLDRSRTQFDLNTSDGRTAAFDRLLQSVILLPDEIQRVTTVTDLADHIGLQQGVALNRLRQVTNQRARSQKRVASRGDGLSPGEQLLVVLLVNNEDARTELLEPALEISEALPSRRILAAIKAVLVAGSEFEYAAVEGRLDKDDRDRLGGLIFDSVRPEVTIQEGREAMLAMQRTVAEGHYRDVRRNIAAAEQSGDLTEIARLLERRTELERKLGLRLNPGS